jgi:hypothetical protein
MAKKKNIIAPNDERAVAAMDKRQNEIEKAEELYGDGLPFDQSRLEIGIKARTAASINMMIQNGRDYHRLKAHLPHGEFITCVERTSGKSRSWAYQCMEVAEMVSNNPQMLTEVNIWTVGQFRALAVFEKPVIEEYLKGGPLGDIPHDDVATMPRGDLEAEARRLRKTVDNMKTSHKQAMQQKEAKICELDDRLHDKLPPTREQRAEIELEPLKKKLFEHVMQAQFHLDEAVNAVAAAQKVEGASFPQLQEWGKTHYEHIAPIGDLFDELDQALVNCGPDKPGKGN